jgi:hypothetical protein
MRLTVLWLAFLTAFVPLSGEPAFSAAAADAERAMLAQYYAGGGLWRDCDRPQCHSENQDWGVDSATYALYLRWSGTRDPRLASIARTLVRTAPNYPEPCNALPCSSWSDVPEWDTIALMRDYAMTGADPEALARAKRAFAFVERARVFRLGACPAIHYQKPGGGANYELKTLETDANYIKAALLLYDATRERTYLDAAIREYAAVRAYFLDRTVPLYSVYVFDDGRHCTQVPHRFFASVNGDMIWNGIMLAHVTGKSGYLHDALATAHGVDRDLSDGAGIFADLQAENDVEEPLIEAMYDLAAYYHQQFARSWVLRNAAAALSERAAGGAFGRFFDGPVSHAQAISIWQGNGGFALEFAAAALAPNAVIVQHDPWNGARFIRRRIASLPAVIAFDGSAIALVGTLGERCCEPGHARIFIDGTETFDGTGIWQNKSMIGGVPNSILFAWRWPHAGHHEIRLEPGIENAKEGGPFIDLDGYILSK